MPKNAVCQEGITSDCDRETRGPHQPQHLQDVMPDSDIRDMAKGAYVVVEHEVPRLDHKSFKQSDQGFVPFTDGDGMCIGQTYII